MRSIPADTLSTLDQQLRLGSNNRSRPSTNNTTEHIPPAVSINHTTGARLHVLRRYELPHAIDDAQRPCYPRPLMMCTRARSELQHLTSAGHMKLTAGSTKLCIDQCEASDTRSRCKPSLLPKHRGPLCRTPACEAPLQALLQLRALVEREHARAGVDR